MANFALNPPTTPLSNPALQTGVYLYAPTGTINVNPYTLIPNVTWRRIEYREGSAPPVAELEYILDDNLAATLGWPSRFEQIWPIDATGPYVVPSDARIAILATNPDGTTRVMFDGFASIPQIDVTGSSQSATFAAQGASVRCFDRPITGRVQRNSDAASINLTDGSADVETDLPCRFNPVITTVSDGNKGGYLPNCSPKGKETINNNIGNYPVFIDEGLEVVPDVRTHWSIPKALKILLATYNEQETYVNVPTFSALDDLLQAEYPPDDGQIFDPTMAATSRIPIRDYDCSNKCWPPVVEELLSYAGFVMRWDTSTDYDGVNARTDLKIYRRDAANATAPKRIYLAALGSAVDPNQSNAARIHLVRDAGSIVNAYQVETSQRRVEVRVRLAPLYTPAAGDEISPARDGFNSTRWTGSTTALVRRKYRRYGVGELGDGCWVNGALSNTPMDFSPVFPVDEDGDPTYVRRYRPGSHALISLDSAGHPLKAILQVQMPVQGMTANQAPYVVNSVLGAPIEATLLTIAKGWRLLDDRLGIEVSIEDPETWATGNPLIPKIAGVTWWANPPSSAPVYGQSPIFYLTTVIEDDLRMPISEGKRIASPTGFTRFRITDGRDHFQYNSVSLGSPFYTAGGGDGTNPLVIRDDTAAATTHCKQLRSATEFPPIAGSITIPYITNYYEVGDRLWKISGRGANLQTNVGVDQGESPDWPWIVGVAWTNSGDRQETVLTLSDHRSTPSNL